MEFLEKLLGRQIMNLEEYSCPSFRNLPRVNEHFCFYHGRKRKYFACALCYAYKLRVWLLKTLYSVKASVDVVDVQQKTVEELAQNVSQFNVSEISKSPASSGSITHTCSSSSTDTKSRGKSKMEKENHYTNIDHEQSTASESSNTHQSTNSQSVCCRSNPLCAGKTVCNCS